MKRKGKKKPGPKPIPNGKRSVIVIRVSKDQKAAYKQKAKKAGMNVSAWLTDLANKA